MIGTEIHETENTNVNKTNSLFFKKSNEIGKPLERQGKTKKRKSKKGKERTASVKGM